MTTPIRSSQVYIPNDLAARLRFVADVKDCDTPDTLATEILAAWIDREYPGLESVMMDAAAARKKVLETARESLRAKLAEQVSDKAF